MAISQAELREPVEAPQPPQPDEPSPRQAFWRRLRAHRLAMAAAVVLAALFVVVLVPDFFAYSRPTDADAKRANIPPQSIHFFENGSFSPHVNGLIGTRDPETLELVYRTDPDRRYDVRLFAKGYRYELLGLIPTRIHLIGIAGASTEDHLFLLGSDGLGRDQWSRLMLGTRLSLTIGLVGVLVSLVFGTIVGGISGYYGGRVDLVIQRFIELLWSIPTIPLWLGLAAVVPRDWSVVRVYFILTLIIALLGWAELARVVRGRFLAMRDTDMVTAARAIGCSERRIILRHMMPEVTSHLIAAATLAVPTMIIAETSLSFLGLGLRPPAISWGVMLKDAQNVQVIVTSPWLLIPGAFVAVAILAFNLLGDGLRDAADPYKS